MQEDEAIAKTLEKCKTTFLSFLEKFSLTTLFQVLWKDQEKIFMKKSSWKDKQQLFPLHYSFQPYHVIKICVAML